MDELPKWATDTLKEHTRQLNMMGVEIEIHTRQDQTLQQDLRELRAQINGWFWALLVTVIAAGVASGLHW